MILGLSSFPERIEDLRKDQDGECLAINRWALSNVYCNVVN